MIFGFSSLRFIVVSAILPFIASASLTWEIPQVNATAKLGDKEVVAPFLFKNTGTTSVTIRDIQSGCECTVAELAKRTYAPGEEGSIKAVFTLGARTGRHEKLLTITTDDPSAPTVTLTLKVNIEELIALSARMLRWKVGDVPTEQVVEVNALRQHRITRLELKELKPAEQANARIMSDESGQKYRLFIRPDSLDQPRTVTLTFVAHFADGEQQTFAVFAVAR